MRMSKNIDSNFQKLFVACMKLIAWNLAWGPGTGPSPVDSGPTHGQSKRMAVKMLFLANPNAN